MLLIDLFESDDNNLESKLKSYKLKRYKNKVGKSIGGFVYFHKDYINQFPEWEDNINEKIEMVPKSFKWNCIKYNIKSHDVTFIDSPDFDMADEPLSSDNYTIKNDETIKQYSPKTPTIWHHKWMWVMDDYNGFDVNASKQRSIFWLKELDDHPDPKIRSKIGSKRVWDNLPFNKESI